MTLTAGDRKIERAAPIGGSQEHWDRETSAVAGVPAMVPAGFTSDGLPVGRP